MDALTYAEIKNNSSTDKDLSDFGTKIKDSTYTGQDITTRKEKLDTLLSDTTIKRACCMAKNDTSRIINSIDTLEGSKDLGSEHIYIDVRIPIPEKIKTKLDNDDYPNDYLSEAYMWEMYNYWDKRR